MRNKRTYIALTSVIISCASIAICVAMLKDDKLLNSDTVKVDTVNVDTVKVDTVKLSTVQIHAAKVLALDIPNTMPFDTVKAGQFRINTSIEDPFDEPKYYDYEILEVSGEYAKVNIYKVTSDTTILLGTDSGHVSRYSELELVIDSF